MTPLRGRGKPVIEANLSFVFGAADTTKSNPLSLTGLLKHLHLRVPTFTNTVTATVSLVNADGYTVWSSAAKAMGANYQLESDAAWIDQLLIPGMTLAVTLSGAPGGTGGTVIVLLREYGS